MTTTVTPADQHVLVPAPRDEATFLWFKHHRLTPRHIVDAIASYLVTFGDNIGAGAVHLLDAIHDEAEYTGIAHLADWARHKAPADVATIRARADQIARDYFGHHFPPLTW